MTTILKTIIVNENDEIIGHKSREEVRKDDMYRVSALWIKNSKGEVLLAQRGFNKTHDPGIWGPAVAGTNDEGETYKSNIIKETEEEIGLVDFDFKLAGKLRKRGNHNYFCQWFVATIDQDLDKFKIQKDEVERLKWFTKEELQKESENNPSNYLSSVKYCLNEL